jgi:hypothetical protein
MHKLGFVNSLAASLAALLASLGLLGSDAIGAELEGDCNTRPHRSERTPSRHRRREWCRSLYRRGASDWASAGRACHQRRNSSLSALRSTGVEPKLHHRVGTAEVKGGGNKAPRRSGIGVPKRAQVLPPRLDRSHGVRCSPALTRGAGSSSRTCDAVMSYSQKLVTAERVGRRIVGVFSPPLLH